MILNLNMIDWSCEIDTLEIRPCAMVKQWLTKPYKLGNTLEKVYGIIDVKLISQTFEQPLKSELELLKDFAHGSPYFIRQIYLKHKDQILVYGRVAIPEETFIDNKDKILDLNEQSFGEKILYSHPNYTRSAFEYAYIERDLQPHWGRRSIFLLNNNSLIVTEVFMTHLRAYPT